MKSTPTIGSSPIAGHFNAMAASSPKPRPAHLLIRLILIILSLLPPCHRELRARPSKEQGRTEPRRSRSQSPSSRSKSFRSRSPGPGGRSSLVVFRSSQLVFRSYGDFFRPSAISSRSTPVLARSTPVCPRSLDNFPGHFSAMGGTSPRPRPAHLLFRLILLILSLLPPCHRELCARS
jgi:hypothetical protein